MIYHVTWGNLGDGIVVNQWNKRYYGNLPIGTVLRPKEDLVKFIKESEDDTFVFIFPTTLMAHYYWHPFNSWLDANDFRKNIVLQTGKISNPIHPDRRHELVVVVLQSDKHFQREEAK